MLQRFDCNLQHLWRRTPCMVRHSCYWQCYQDSYTGDRAWQRVHILRMWKSVAGGEIRRHIYCFFQSYGLVIKIGLRESGDMGSSPDEC